MTQLRCAFCGRPRSKVQALALAPVRLAGLPIAICGDCALSAAIEIWGPEQEPVAEAAD